MNYIMPTGEYNKAYLPSENRWKKAEAWIIATWPSRLVKLAKLDKSGLAVGMSVFKSSSSDDMMSAPTNGTGNVGGVSLKSLKPRFQNSIKQEELD